MPHYKDEMQKLYADSPRDTAAARKFKPIIRALLGLPDGDKDAMKEYLKSKEHARNVRRMMKPYHGI